MANEHANKVIIGNDVVIDLTSDTVTADKIVSGYTAHDASGTPIVGTCVRNPIEPIAFDYEPGYTNNGSFVYQNSTNNHTDVYEVEAGHKYLLTLGGTVGSRFRAAVLPSNPVGTTTDIAGTMVINKNSPAEYDCTTFTVSSGGLYLVITKDNVSKKGLKSYLFDIADLTAN